MKFEFTLEDIQENVLLVEAGVLDMKKIFNISYSDKEEKQ